MSHSQAARPVAPLIRRKWAYAALALGLVCLVSGAVGMWRELAARQRLESVDARIRISEPVSFRPDGEVRYRTQLEITYLVNGQRYSVPVSVPEVAADRQELDNQLRRFGAGSTVRVLYAPARPDDIQLDLESVAPLYGGPLALLAAGLTALTTVFIAIAHDGRYQCAVCGTGVAEMHAFCYMCGKPIPTRKGRMAR